MRHPIGLVRVNNLTSGTEIANLARIAKSMIQRARGLMFERELEEGAGLIINPCNSIHMFGMRFPLDVLYVDRDNRVVRVQEGIKPWRIGPLYTRGARYVIELPVGTIARTGTQVGDQLRLDEPE